MTGAPARDLALSVVIPTNEYSDALAGHLRLATGGRLPEETWEAVVALSGLLRSPPRRREIPNARFVARAGLGAPGRNLALRATGRRILFLDADCLPAPGLLPATPPRGRGDRTPPSSAASTSRPVLPGVASLRHRRLVPDLEDGRDLDS
jgi:hypothetical protein